MSGNQNIYLLTKENLYTIRDRLFDLLQGNTYIRTVVIKITLCNGSTRSIDHINLKNCALLTSNGCKNPVVASIRGTNNDELSICIFDHQLKHWGFCYCPEQHIEPPVIKFSDTQVVITERLKNRTYMYTIVIHYNR